MCERGDEVQADEGERAAGWEDVHHGGTEGAEEGCILRRIGETKAHEVCFGEGEYVLRAVYYDGPLAYGDDDTINITAARLVDLACDLRDRAVRAEARVRELEARG